MNLEDSYAAMDHITQLTQIKIIDFNERNYGKAFN